MNKTIYWALQVTWGIIMNIAGLFTYLFLITFMKNKIKIHKNGYSVIIEVGGNWGGVNLGALSLCGDYSKTNGYWFEHTRRHEFGHSIQNIIFGPLHLFIVAIPSFIRYWYQRIEIKKGKYFDGDWYESIWFESQATEWGTKAIEKIEAK